MADLPKRYDIATDEFVPVTQDWVDEVQKKFAALGFMLTNARELQKGLDGFLTLWEENKNG